MMSAYHSVLLKGFLMGLASGGLLSYGFFRLVRYLKEGY